MNAATIATKASPLCCKEHVLGECELDTLSASQIASAAIFAGYLGYIAYRVTESETDASWYLKIPCILGCVFCMAYYFFGCWIVEEEHIDKFRSFKGWIAWSEFILRIGILIVFAMFGLMVQHMIPEKSGLTRPGMSGVSAVLLCLTIVIILALIWDLIIWLGETHPPTSKSISAPHACSCANAAPSFCPMTAHQQEHLRADQTSVAGRFFKIDLFGLVPIVFLIGAIRLGSDLGEAIASYAFTIFALYAAWRASKMLHPTLTRRFHRNRLR